MTPQEWEALKKETADALEGGPVASGAARRLLRYRDAAEGFLEQPALAVAANSWIGRLIGPYRVVRKIAHGGMAVVYLAERADGAFERQVAVKVIRPLCDRDEFLRRFERERRVLAMLDHPNIARLIDGGSTEDGFSFIAMEHVDGVPVSEFARGLTGREPVLRLFLDIVLAVGCAHQHLVVHRDLKPSNILVAADGEPKLLDFGIARLLDESDSSRTQTALRLFTPRYASPEQFRGEGVSVATDIYSLGVLLYELLTGASPYGDRASTAELREAVCEGAVARTSLPADLDSIIRKALRKDPRDRYRSAAALSEDLERFLANRPVEARPLNTLHRAWRCVQRNALPVAAGVTAAALLIGASAVASYQARNAEFQRRLADKRLSEVRSLAGALLFDFGAQLSELPGSEPIQKEMIARAKTYLESLQDGGPPDDSLRSDIALAYHRLALAQRQLNQLVEARESASRAVDILERLLANRRLDTALGKRLAQSLYLRSEFVGDRDRLDDLRRALPLFEAQCGASCDPESRNSLASFYARLSAATAHGGWHGESVFYLRKELAELEQLRRTLSEPGLLFRIGMARKRLGDRVGAEEALEAEVTETRRQVALIPGDPAPSERLARVLEKLAEVRVGSRPEAALRHYQEAADLWRRRCAAEPRDTRSRSFLAESLEHLGAVQRSAGALQSAGRSYTEALTIRRALLAANPAARSLKRRVSISLHGIADVSYSRGRYAEAMRYYGEASALRSEIYRAAPTESQARIDLAVSCAGLGKTAEAMLDRRAALRHYSESVELRELVLTSHPRLREPQRKLLTKIAGLQRALGDAASASLTLARIEALDRLDQAVPPAVLRDRRGG